ncbi:MAG: hypothetical protein AB8B58_03115 [Roseobacter sp.]
MSTKNTLGFFHPPSSDDPAWAGWSRVVDSISEIALSVGWDVLQPNVLCITRSVPDQFTVSYACDPQGAYGVVADQAHRGPFWQIDTTVTPWEREVSRARFIAGSMDGDAANIFFHYWRDRFFGDAPNRTTKEGFVVIALQGILSRKSAGQFCSPLSVVEQCLLHEPDRPLIVSLAAHEHYSDADLSRLAALDERHARLTVRIGDRKELLRTCDYVVTQSGDVALDACFYQKTPVLFAKVDAHHIALSAETNPAEAFRTASYYSPEFACYATWFLRDNAINVQSEDTTRAISHRLAALGWPV